MRYHKLKAGECPGNPRKSYGYLYLDVYRPAECGIFVMEQPHA